MEEGIQYIDKLGIETTFVYDFASSGELFLADAISFCDEVLSNKQFSMLLFATCEDFNSLRRIKDGAVVCFLNNQTICSSYRIESGEWINMETLESETPDFEKVSAIYAVIGKSLSDKVLQTFKRGDVVRFKYGINYVEMDEVQKIILDYKSTSKVRLVIDNKECATVTTDRYQIKGKIVNAVEETEYELRISCSNGKTKKKEMNISVEAETFSYEILLQEGANYLEIFLAENGEAIEKTKKYLIVFYKQQSTPKQAIMWVEQYVNANVTNTTEKIENLIETAKHAGITAFALDLKGVEGYCSYKKATRTKTDYMDCTQNEKKKIEIEIDFLDEFVNIAHKKEMLVYGSFNFFVEGNISSNDFAIKLPSTHPEWAEVLYSPETKGQCMSVLDMDRKHMLCYVNPANEQVCNFELERVREVLDHYQIDGVIMDRTRYDNQYADFSDVSRERFERYLEQKGKKLKHWPEDVYFFEDGKNMVQGPLYIEWLTFRSGIICEFANCLRGVIDTYQKKQNRKIKLAAYVGSWYDLYYQNGVNWASSNFVYQEMLKFPVPELYTDEYAKTSYLDCIDFLMIGCYYDTVDMIEKYVTIGNIVVDDKVPMIASLSLPDLDSEQSLCEATETCMGLSDGVMFFDLCYTEWESLSKAMK